MTWLNIWHGWASAWDGNTCCILAVLWWLQVYVFCEAWKTCLKISSLDKVHINTQLIHRNWPWYFSPRSWTDASSKLPSALWLWILGTNSNCSIRLWKTQRIPGLQTNHSMSVCHTVYVTQIVWNIKYRLSLEMEWLLWGMLDKSFNGWIFCPAPCCFSLVEPLA